VTVAREGKFTLPAEVPELVVVLPDALVFVERCPEREVLIRPAEYAPVGVATISPETPLGPLIALFPPGCPSLPARDLSLSTKVASFGSGQPGNGGLEADSYLFFRWSATY
jgi:hypothetical protein